MPKDASTLNLYILILQAVSAVCFAFALIIINSFKLSINSIKESITILNSNIATLLEKDRTKEIALTDHKKSIQKLEDELQRVRMKIHEFGNDVGGLAKVNQIMIEDIKQHLTAIDADLMQLKLGVKK